MKPTYKTNGTQLQKEGRPLDEWCNNTHVEKHRIPVVKDSMYSKSDQVSLRKEILEYKALTSFPRQQREQSFPVQSKTHLDL